MSNFVVTVNSNFGSSIFRAAQRPGIFRLFLAVLVFISHSSRLNLGTAAVFVFFVLSGFWITVMWKGRYSLLSQPYKVYIVSRVWRLLPVFVTCSIISWSVVVIHNAVPANLNWPQQIFSNTLMIGYLSLPFWANNPAWSLDVEMQFYLLAPLWIFAMNRSALTLAVCIAVSAAMYQAQDTHTLAPYLAFFGVGIFAATKNWRPSFGLAGGTAALTIAIILLDLLSPWRGILLGGAHRDPMFAFMGLAEVCIAILLVPWAIYTTAQQSTALDEMFGDLSFTFYLLHWPVLMGMNALSGSYAHRALMTLGSFVITTTGALMLWLCVDKPANRLRSAWVRTQSLR